MEEEEHECERESKGEPFVVAVAFSLYIFKK